MVRIEKSRKGCAFFDRVYAVLFFADQSSWSEKEKQRDELPLFAHINPWILRAQKGLQTAPPAGKVV